MYNEDFGANEGDLWANSSSVPDNIRIGAACPSSRVTTPAWANAHVGQELPAALVLAGWT